MDGSDDKRNREKKTKDNNDDEKENFIYSIQILI